MESFIVLLLSVTLVTAVLQVFTLVVVIVMALMFKSVLTTSLDKMLDFATQGRDKSRDNPPRVRDSIRFALKEPAPMPPPGPPPKEMLPPGNQSTSGPKVPAPAPAPGSRVVSRVPSSTEPRLPASDPAWRWLSFKKYEKKSGEVEVKPIDETENATDDDGPFKVHYHIYIGNRRACPDPVEVVVTSPSLIACLQRCLPDHGDLKSIAQPTISGRDLYVVLQTLKSCEFEAGAKSALRNGPDSVAIAPQGSHAVNGGHQAKQVGEKGTKEAGADDGSESGTLYVKHLVRFLEGEYKDVLTRESRMREEKRVTWDMLWAFLPKGTKVGYYCDLTDDLVCAEVAGTHYSKPPPRPFGGRDDGIFVIKLKVYNYNGTHFKACEISREIEYFHEEHEFSDLAVCPIDFLGELSDLEKKFLANGKRFYELAVSKPNRYMVYDGSMYWKENCGPISQLNVEKADGRVMIDLCSFAAMKPGYPMGSARPPSKSRRGLGGFNTKINTEDENSSNLIFAPATVYGFSFALKRWGCFSISGFSDITFDRGAFQDLVMEPTLKTLVHDLVRQYVSSGNDIVDVTEQVDFIREKGKGTIVLCHGPPGTGKTLTAESIAESMDCPLWALSVSELGTNPKDLETTLMKVLHIASLWKAVLLLDEADIYLERRQIMDVIRNSMTGVFLRQLEYFRGILFLTTNRGDTFDDAIKSRISIFLQYKELDMADKAKVWGNLLRKSRVEGTSPEFCEKMAGRLANGREIRNAIRTAQIWAKSKGEPLEAKHIEYVLDPQVGIISSEKECDKFNFYFL